MHTVRDDVDRPQQKFGRQKISRRTFLGTTACLAGGTILDRAEGPARQAVLRAPAGGRVSRVVRAGAREVVVGHSVHPALLREMLQDLLTTITQRPTEKDAWRALLDPGDIIGLKFNRSGQEVIGTSDAMVDALVASIVDSGWRKDQIVCIEAPEHAVRRLGTASPWFGYATEVTSFASGSDQLAEVLDQVSAIIDVPFLKTHNIAGLTCALKNLSHGFIKHPARFHGNGCSPFIGDIVAIPKIGGKLRLCVVDAMRVVFEGGPAASSSAIADVGSLLASVDPVAVDAVGLSVLNEIRLDNGLQPIARSAQAVEYLRSAHEAGVGVVIPEAIELIRLAP